MTQEVLNLLQSPSAESTEAGRAVSEDLPEKPPLQGEVPPQGAEGSKSRGGDSTKPLSLADARQLPLQGSQAPTPSPDPAILSHLGSLRAQEAELRREIPDFRLEDAFQDTDFLRLTSPTVGISVRRAYFALHAPEMERRAAEESARRLAQSVASGARRPREGGGHTAAALTAADPARLDPAQRRALKERITAAAARGEKIYP